MKLPPFVYTQKTKLCGICCVLFMTSQSAYAVDLNISKLSTNNTTYDLNLSYDSSNNQELELLEFQEKDLLYMFSIIKNELLTFYSTKNTNLEATYKYGGYYLNFTNHW